MVIKSLQTPDFNLSKINSKDQDYINLFNEVVYKMAQYYFAIFQALFTKDSDSMRPLITHFLGTKDPLHRSRKLVSLYEEMIEMMDQKIMYANKTVEEHKERSKQALLEGAF